MIERIKSDFYDLKYLKFLKIEEIKIDDIKFKIMNFFKQQLTNFLDLFSTLLNKNISNTP